MIPLYSIDSQHCEWCDDEICIGYEAIQTNDGLFCDTDCLKEHLCEMEWAKAVYLTDEEIYREEDY